jgi:glycerophosphoryl diester phosphodiesterase
MVHELPIKRPAKLIGAVLMVAVLVAAVAFVTADRPADRSLFDIQAHRGGLGLRPESSLAAFANALRLGVTTLELDVQITKDGRAVVTHDRRITPVVCRDTGPAEPGDPEFPYLGKLVKDLTMTQLATLDCGTRRPSDPRVDPVVDTQIPIPDSRMVLLDDVFALVNRAGAGDDDGVRLNIETKVEAGAPEETAPREQFVQVTVDAVRRAELVENVSIQSFDWGALKRVRQIEPRVPIVALVDPALLQAGQPGPSPWLGGIDIDDFAGDPVRAAASFDADAVSPVHGNPQTGSVLDTDYRPYTTAVMVDTAHAAGMRVIPWTVNDIPTMNHLIDMHVDGIITDYPDRLRDLLKVRGAVLPRSFTAPR